LIKLSEPTDKTTLEETTLDETTPNTVTVPMESATLEAQMDMVGEHVTLLQTRLNWMWYQKRNWKLRDDMSGRGRDLQAQALDLTDFEMLNHAFLEHVKRLLTR